MANGQPGANLNPVAIHVEAGQKLDIDHVQIQNLQAMDGTVEGHIPNQESVMMKIAKVAYIMACICIYS